MKFTNAQLHNKDMCISRHQAVKAEDHHTWMMKRMIGFLLSYSLGLDPSNTPPCGCALRDVGVAEAAAVVAAVAVIAMMEDMMVRDQQLLDEGEGRR